MRKEWIAILIGTMAALLLAVGGTWIFTQASQAEAAELIESAVSESELVAAQDMAPASQLMEDPIQANNVTANQAFAAPRGNRGDHARGGLGDQIDREALLADALGITVEELQAAHESARQAGIQQAVEEGLITQEEADQMLAGEGKGPHRGFGRGHHGKFGSQDAQIDHKALLADALGITVEQLEAAQQEARDAAIQQAIDEGLITQEEADMMAAHQALKAYIDREAITAQALGISVADLQAAHEEGKTVRTLIDELGLDRETFHTNMEAAHEAAIQQAVADGVITQEQADQIQEGNGRGFRGPRGPRGPHGCDGSGGKSHFRGNDGHFQNAPTIPANDA